MNRKRQISVILLVAFLLCLTSLTACRTEEISYQVSVTDAIGNPYTKGIAVKFMKGEEQAGIQAVNQNGVAEMRLPKGNYTAVLQFGASETEYSYEQTDLTLSESKTQLSVVVNRRLSDLCETLHVGEEEYVAHFVDPGCTEFTLNAEKMTYFLFSPTQAGKYKFSLLDSDFVIGYYGTPQFVLQESAVPLGSTVSVSVSEEQTGEDVPPLVLGVATGEGKAVLAISRVADAELVEQIPWNTDWRTGHSKAEACRVELTKKPRYFDITAKSGKYNFYYDETTGYYRVKENGPAVLVALGKNNNPECPTVGIYERVCGNGMYGGSDVVRYFYNENGELEKREKYTDMLLEMFDHSGITAYDQEIYHPLTQEWMYVLKNGFAEWWNPESPDYQEVFEKANPEYAWLFACCYER